MYQEQCRLTIADKFFGPLAGGGAPQIPQRDFNQELGDIKTGVGANENLYAQFRNKKDPILKDLYGQALNSPLLEALKSKGLETLTGGQSDLLEKLTNYAQGLDLSGKLTPEQLRETDQGILSSRGSSGNLYSNASIFEQALNRDKYSRERAAENVATSTTIEGLGEADAARRFGIASSAVQSAFQLPESVLSTGVDAYTKLSNPIIGYLSDLFGGNQSAAADQAIAGANAKAGGTSGALGAIGSIVGGAATAY